MSAGGSAPHHQSEEHGVAQGVEAAYHRVLWEHPDRSVRFGVEATFNYAPLSFQNQGQLAADVRLDHFAYPLQGVRPPSAPYAGTFFGPGTMILDNPLGLVPQTIVNGATLWSNRHLDLDMYGIRLGPRLSGELRPRLYGMVDAGLALVVVDGSFAYQDTLQGGLSGHVSGHSTRQDVLPGWYFGLGLQHALNDRWGLLYQIKLQGNGDYNLGVDGRSVGLSLDPSVLQTFGLSYSF